MNTDFVRSEWPNPLAATIQFNHKERRAAEPQPKGRTIEEEDEDEEENEEEDEETTMDNLRSLRKIAGRSLNRRGAMNTARRSRNQKG